MSTELIKAIQVLPDGVYLTSKSSNDNLPYHTCQCDSLSEVYYKEGQPGLDCEIIQMLFNYAQLRGTCESIMRYRYALEIAETREIFKRYTEQRNKRFLSLSQEDQQGVLQGINCTPRAVAHIKCEKEEENKVFSEIAHYCTVYEKLQVRPSEKKYPRELLKRHPSILATFTEDYDIGNCNPPRYKKGDRICLVWYQASRTTGYYAECENGSFPIPAKDFNRVLVYEMSED